jgi:alanyl-tRNA synthetase
VGPFAIVHEGSVSAGVRRLEALTGTQVDNLRRENGHLLEQLALSLKVTPDRLLERVERLLEENRELKSRRGGPAGVEVPAGAVERSKIGDIVFARGVYDGLDGKGLLAAYDRLKKEARRLIVALASRRDGKLQLLVALTPPLAKDGWDAREIFRSGAKLVEARGGGRPEMVQAGGKVPEAAEEALRAMEEWVTLKAKDW